MSNNPYKVLGVSPDASDEEIKRAYRELARKYHPDRHKDNDLADLASEKMKEINAAYEEIQQLRAGGPRGEQSGNAGGSNANYSQDARGKFVLIRNCINSGNITEAERLLAEIEAADRGAEWHFLRGCVYLRKGAYVDAQREFDTAYRMEPTNNEYFRFKEELRNRTTQFGGGYQTSGSGGCCSCDMCSTLLCADCCCECMGGDLIPCC